MRFAVAVLLVAFPLVLPGLSGCGSGNPQWPVEQRDRDRLQALERLRPRAGQASAEQIERELGAPDYTEENGRFYGYCIEFIEKRRMRYGPWDLAHEDYKVGIARVVVMQFGDDGVLQRICRRTVPDGCAPGDTFDEVVRSWQIAHGSDPSIPAAPVRTPA